MEIKDLFPEYDENIDFETFMKNGVDNTKTLLPFHLKEKAQDAGFERYCAPTFFTKDADSVYAHHSYTFFLLQALGSNSPFIFILGRNDESCFSVSIFYKRDL